MKKKYTTIILSLLALLLFQCSDFDSASPASSDSGTSGSLAAMSIVGDYLFVLDNLSIKTFYLREADKPQEVGETIYLDPGVETMFPHDNKLFIGSQTGMYILDITDPTDISVLAEHSHFFGCDPVVVNDSIAFVTVRSAEACRGFVEANQLEVVDVTDPMQPNTLEFIDLNNPAGLGLDNQYLFVTDGDAGIQVFDVSAPRTGIELIGNIPVNAFDVIPLDGLLIAVGLDNLYQFDYNDINNIVQISSFKYRL